MKVDSLLFSFLRCVGLIFFHEKLRSCKTETVNALFYVSHHENIFSLVYPPGNKVCEKLLHKIAVLILVHENLVVFFRKLPCCLAWRKGIPFFCHEDLKGKMLHICKIDDIFFPLLFSKAVHKFLCKADQDFHRLSAAKDCLCRLFQTLRKIPLGKVF